MIIETKVQLNSVNWKDFYVEGYDGDVTLSEENIHNWDDVVENIKDSKKKSRVKKDERLSGDEYPQDTPIVLSLEYNWKFMHEIMDDFEYPDLDKITTRSNNEKH